jgi:N-acetyl-anhydromuramyl-L-alanine amidase AmpD
MRGHCGVYIGDGKVVESTPIWKNGVQITALSARKWLKHGKLPYVEYEEVATVTVTLPVLRKGSKGETVETLQRLLNSYGSSLTLDGDFGANTDRALRAFQKAQKLTVDGICGKESWKRLLCVK